MILMQQQKYSGIYICSTTNQSIELEAVTIKISYQNTVIKNYGDINIGITINSNWNVAKGTMR